MLPAGIAHFFRRPTDSYIHQPDCEESRMGSRRHGEHGDPPPFRNSRLYRANGHWFFDTREGTQFGPFALLDDARVALAVFVAQNVYERPGKRLRRDDCPGAADALVHMVEEVVDVLRCHVDFGALAAENWARSRLEDLEQDNSGGREGLERVRVLAFVRECGENIFDPDIFLQRRA